MIVDADGNIEIGRPDLKGHSFKVTPAELRELICGDPAPIADRLYRLITTTTDSEAEPR